jgi:hypothetical protein
VWSGALVQRDHATEPCPTRRGGGGVAGNAANAGLLAARIIGTTRPAVQQAMMDFQARTRRLPPRARPHYRFGPLLIISDLLRDSVPLVLKRQCDRTLLSPRMTCRGVWLRHPPPPPAARVDPRAPESPGGVAGGGGGQGHQAHGAGPHRARARARTRTRTRTHPPVVVATAAAEGAGFEAARPEPPSPPSARRAGLRGLPGRHAEQVDDRDVMC